MSGVYPMPAVSNNARAITAEFIGKFQNIGKILVAAVVFLILGFIFATMYLAFDNTNEWYRVIYKWCYGLSAVSAVGAVIYGFMIKNELALILNTSMGI